MLPGCGSESDFELNREVEIDFSADYDPSLRLCWDSFQIEDDREVNEEFEWEEVDEGVDEREVLSMFLNDDEHDEYNYTAEYEMLFGQFAESENAVMGRPPAAKNVVKNLPFVVLIEEDLKKNNLICAVRKRWHWAGRYELPTDDPDYERTKRDQKAARVI
ncbi:hypothetical protein ACH5RR_008694 [Cinchona calisaya]|uniref:Transposase n=1 Tax=Cinchona calisaya TaxID=153742 RepID=A0ABD3AF27_9GENT